MDTESDGDDLHTDLNRAQKCSDTTIPTEAATPPTPNLPEEVIADILSRLPVKPLGRFRCVSKPWRSLISDPHFIKKHLHISTTTKDETYTNHRLIMSREIKKSILKTCSLNSIYNEPSSLLNTIKLAYLFKNQSRRRRRSRRDLVVGHCNGLLCLKLGGNDGLVLWNPSINEFRILPDTGIRMREGNVYFSQTYVYGFGYDNASDDYKLLGVLCVVGRDDDVPSETEVGVYSLRTNTWKRIPAFPYGLPNDRESAKLVGGNLIWSVLLYTDRPTSSLDPATGELVLDMHSDWKIIAFDLASETYQEVPQPDPTPSDGFDEMLGTLKGCLCIMDHERGVHVDVWVMKEFGVKESWTKLLTIPYLGKFVWDDGFPFYLPLNLSNDGEVLMEFKSRLVIYNTKDKTFRSPVICNFDWCLESYVYIESLVSPNAVRRD